ncbi:hypothetical protein AX15_000133 [Amanita polypyramis BW_CC]|nr:hypothetical protein AX15_000133 [Amanita polypyramis BW_CC]
MILGSELENTTKPTSSVLPPEFYDKFLSASGKLWKPSPIWSIVLLERRPGVISMLAGKPNSATFPFTSLSVKIRSSEGGEDTRLDLSDEELHTALQYGGTQGMPVLVDLLTDFMKHIHGRGDNEGWRLSIGPGTQDYLFKTFTTLLDPGDSVIVEAPTYPGVMGVLGPLKARIFGVATDADGTIPQALEKLLENWPADTPKPKLLYTIPYGSNPSGHTTTQERRIEILHLARKHNLMIIEDDPFFHVYFGTKPRPASYLSLERSLGGEIGRVLRFDSFSKVLASGFRFGWVTGPTVLIDAIDNFNMSTTVQCSSLTQMLVYKALSTWGVSGFLNHTARVSDFYRARRDVFEACVRRHLTGLAEWSMPDAGMFYWIKVHLPPSSDIDFQAIGGADGGESDEGDSTLLFRRAFEEKNVLILPGGSAYFDNRRTPYIRMSFGLISEGDMEKAMGGLASAIREEWDAWEIINYLIPVVAARLDRLELINAGISDALTPSVIGPPYHLGGLRLPRLWLGHTPSSSYRHTLISPPMSLLTTMRFNFAAVAGPTAKPPPLLAAGGPAPNTSTLRSHASSAPTSIHHKVTNNSSSKKRRALFSKARQLGSAIGLRRFQSYTPRADKAKDPSPIGAGRAVATPAQDSGGIAASFHVHAHGRGTMRGRIKHASYRKDKFEDVDDSWKLSIKRWLTDVYLANANEKSDDELSSEPEVQILAQTRADAQERSLSREYNRGRYIFQDDLMVTARRNRNKSKSRLNLRKSGHTTAEEKMFLLSSLVLRAPESTGVPTGPRSSTDDVSVIVVDESEPEKNSRKVPPATRTAGPPNSHLDRTNTPGSSIKSTTGSSHRRSVLRARRLKSRLRDVRVLGPEVDAVTRPERDIR